MSLLQRLEILEQAYLAAVAQNGDIAPELHRGVGARLEEVRRQLTEGVDPWRAAFDVTALEKTMRGCEAVLARLDIVRAIKEADRNGIGHARGVTILREPSSRGAKN